MTDLTGHKAIVTGGASGIGAAISTALIGAGAEVVVMGRNKERLARFADQSGATPIAVDVCDEASVERAFDAAFADQPASILIANAGAAETAPAHRTDVALWRRMIEVNLTGVFLCARAMLARMNRASYGRIIAVASAASLKGYAYTSAYAAAKHGALGFMRSLAKELADGGVTANVLCPGFTDTDIVKTAIANITSKTGRSEKQALAELTAHNPQGRLVAPEEVARAAVWLCDHQSQSVNGAAIAIDGGETA